MGSLEALAVDDRRAALLVLRLGDPHLCERVERRQDRSPDPDRVLALFGGDDLHLHRLVAAHAASVPDCTIATASRVASDVHSVMV
eukprot:3933997-Rhodomonas_salina.2